MRVGGGAFCYFLVRGGNPRVGGVGGGYGFVFAARAGGRCGRGGVGQHGPGFFCNFERKAIISLCFKRKPTSSVGGESGEEGWARAFLAAGRCAFVLFAAGAEVHLCLLRARGRRTPGHPLTGVATQKLTHSQTAPTTTKNTGCVFCCRQLLALTAFYCCRHRPAQLLASNFNRGEQAGKLNSSPLRLLQLHDQPQRPAQQQPNH